QVAAGEAVKIREELANDSAEADDIEASVFDFEGIEGPLHQMDAIAETLLALRELEGAAYAAIAVFGVVGEIVGANRGRAAVESGEVERKANQPAVIKSAQDMSASFAGDNEDRRRDHVGIGIAPDLALQVEAGVEFREGLAGANDDFGS